MGEGKKGKAVPIATTGKTIGVFKSRGREEIKEGKGGRKRGGGGGNKPKDLHFSIKHSGFITGPRKEKKPLQEKRKKKIEISIPTKNTTRIGEKGEGRKGLGKKKGEKEGEGPPHQFSASFILSLHPF